MTATKHWQRLGEAGGRVSDEYQDVEESLVSQWKATGYANSNIWFCGKICRRVGLDCVIDMGQGPLVGQLHLEHDGGIIGSKPLATG